MPRRRDVLPEELTKIISLRQSKTSWLQIQRATGVPRQIAKRAHEAWERSQSREELKAARKDVAAEEFRNHLVCLTKLAQLLVNILDIPRPSLHPISGKDVLLNLWRQDIVGEYGAYGLPKIRRKVETYQPETCLRQNLILFESLKAHTHEKVDWQTLGQWENIRDRCTRVQDKLRQEASKTLSNILNQKLGLKEKIVKGSGKKDVVERMVDGVLYVVWQGILAGEPDQLPVVQTISLGHPRVEVVFGEDQFSQGLIFAEADLVKEVEDTCIWVAKNLAIVRKEDMVELVNDVRTIRKIIDELTGKLNPLMLRPLILNTRCELCPA